MLINLHIFYMTSDKMDSIGAIRFLGTNFIDSCEDFLDEETHENAKLVLENASNKSLLKKMKKIMKPFEEMTSCDEPVTPEKFKQLNFFKEDADFTQEQVDKIMKQATMCYTFSKAMAEIDPATLKQIENVAKTIQLGLETELGNMPDADKTDVDPTEMVTKLFSALSETSETDPEAILNRAVSTLGDMEGTNANAISDAVNKIVPTMMSALKTDTSNTTLDTRKKRLLEMYNNIDGGLR